MEATNIFGEKIEKIKLRGKKYS